MPSEESLRAMSALRVMRPYLTQLSDGIQRVGMNASRLAIRPMRGTSGRRTDINGVPGVWIAPQHRTHTGAVVLYLHGGAYVSGGLPYAQIMGSYMAAVTDLNVLAIAYRLAPEHPYPAALEDARTAWQYLRALGYDAEDIAIAGESAGGGLTLALTLSLRDAGEPLPGALACMSPWGDLTCSGESAAAFADTDPTLAVDVLRQTALKYAPQEQLMDPLISPAYANFSGFPPTLLQVGGIEVLWSDSQRIAEQMRSAGVPVTLQTWPGMCHVFQIYGFPESRQAIAKLGLFLRKTLGLPANENSSLKQAVAMWENQETS